LLPDTPNQGMRAVIRHLKSVNKTRFVEAVAQTSAVRHDVAPPSVAVRITALDYVGTHTQYVWRL
jgi:hypothetical protein